MSKNRFITIARPTGIFIMFNTNNKEVYLCDDCMKPRDDGYVDNTKDCEHGAEERKWMNNE